MKFFGRKHSARNIPDESELNRKKSADWGNFYDSSTPVPNENHYETLLCLKYGRLYGVISPDAYESGKAELLARL